MRIGLSRLEKNLQFISLAALSEGNLLDLLEIRNQPFVRQNMYTDHVICVDEHLAWAHNVRNSTSMEFFGVFRRGELIGGAGLSNISKLHRRADWAFFVSEKLKGQGLGASLEYSFISMIFANFEIDKLNCEVISYNEKVVKLHKRFGFEVEGVRREHVIRHGQKHDVVLLGITRNEWEVKWHQSIDA